MDRQPIESTLIRALAYHAPSSIPRVELASNGATYGYDVPLSAYLDFLEADSKGAYFHDFIKDVYAFRAVVDETPKPSDPAHTSSWTPGREWPKRQKVQEVLGREMATYKAQKPEFLETHPGQYVLIHGDEVLGFWPTRSEALEAGRQRFGPVPMLAKKVVEEDRVVILGMGAGASSRTSEQWKSSAANDCPPTATSCFWAATSWTG